MGTFRPRGPEVGFQILDAIERVGRIGVEYGHGGPLVLALNGVQLDAREHGKLRKQAACYPGGRCLMRRIPAGPEKGHRERLHLAFLPKCTNRPLDRHLVERFDDLAAAIDAFVDAHDVGACHGVPRHVEPTVDTRPSAPRQVKVSLEARRGQQADAQPLPRREHVRHRGRAQPEPFDVAEQVFRAGLHLRRD